MIVEGNRSVLLAGQAWVIEGDRELAWAERHVGKNPAHKYILGKYVEAETANDNGHIFDTKELETAQSSIAHSPLNLLHHPQYIVGSFIAAEMVYPIAASASVESPANPIVEALSVFWRYYFPQEYAEVEKAHSTGSLFYSMEAIPKSVTCAAVCGETFEYDGRFSESYCGHLNEPAAKKRLNQPHFMGGALIIPPSRPGWKGADITELSSLVESSGSAQAIYEGLQADAPHLAASTWEDMMLQVLVAYHPETAKKFSTAERKQLASQGKALPDGSYPIDDTQSLADAVKAFGREDPAKRGQLKAHIVKQAKALGKTDLLPDHWDV